MPSGDHCHAPALRSGPYCYYHVQPRYRRPKRRRRPKLFVIPPLNDRKNIEKAISQVLNAVAVGRLDERRAGLFIYGLRLAAQFTSPSGDTSFEEADRAVSVPSPSICSVPDVKEGTARSVPPAPSSVVDPTPAEPHPPNPPAC